MSTLVTTEELAQHSEWRTFDCRHDLANPQLGEQQYLEGHIPGALLIDVNAPGFEDATGKLDRSKLYLVHCASGIRSMKACNVMRTLEFTNLVDLKGGFRAWEAAGNKVAK